MASPRLLPAALVLLAAVSLTSGPAPAETISIKCGSKNVTVSGEKECKKQSVYQNFQYEGEERSVKVGEIVECKDNQGNTGTGACMEGRSSCSTEGKTSCQIAVLPTPTPPPRIPGQRPGMPPAGILEGELGGFGPQGPSPTGAPTAPPTAPPVVR